MNSLSNLLQAAYGGGFGMIIIVLTIAFIYFFVIRNKKKEEKPRNNVVRKGQPVISTDGSVRGKIEEITDTVVIISVENTKSNDAFKIGEDGTIIRV